jgi:hypothetical protein
MKRIEERPGERHLDEWAIDVAIYEEFVDVARSTGLAFERRTRLRASSRSLS